MGYKTFTDCVDLVGSACRPFIGTKRYISTGAVDTDHIVDADVEIIDFDGRPSRANLEVSVGDVLFAKMQGTEKTLLIDDMLSNNVYSTGFCAVKAKKGIITDKCLYHLLTSRAFLDQKDKNCSGATQKAITNGGLRKISIKIPDYSEQERIGEQLDRLTAIIHQRRTELQQLDNLVKARFVEMFGDQTQFPMQPLAQNVEEMFIGPFGSALKNEFFVDEDNAYCMVYEQKHAIQKTMDVPTRFVDKTKYDELKRFTVRGGDIIVSCRGTIGEIFSVPEDAPIGIMHPSIMKIRLKKERYRNLFFMMMLEQYMRDSINRAKGSGVKMAVTATELGKELFVVPAIEKQIEFESFVKQIDKSKFVVQQALDKAKLLFDSLMQKYFG